VLLVLRVLVLQLLALLVLLVLLVLLELALELMLLVLLVLKPMLLQLLVLHVASRRAACVESSPDPLIKDGLSCKIACALKARRTRLADRHPRCNVPTATASCRWCRGIVVMLLLLLRLRKLAECRATCGGIRRGVLIASAATTVVVLVAAAGLERRLAPRHQWLVVWHADAATRANKSGRRRGGGEHKVPVAGACACWRLHCLHPIRGGHWRPLGAKVARAERWRFCAHVKHWRVGAQLGAVA
jgi:hypothetical protein